MEDSPGRSFEFGPYRLDVDERQLVRSGEPIRLTPKAFDTLVFLVCRGGHLVSKDELIHALWPDAHVEENNLAQYISLLRHTLDDGNTGGSYIETVPRAGYRFVQPVRSTGPEHLTVLEAPLVPTVEISAPEPRARRRSRGIYFVAAMTVLAVLAAALPFRSQASRPAAAPLVVMPFETDSSEATASGLPLTLTADLRDALARAGRERVLPLERIYRYVGAAAPVAPRDAGRDLHAGTVLSGHVDIENGAPARVHAVLTRVADGRELWAETIDVPNGSLRAIEDRVASSVTLAIGWPRPPLTAATTGEADTFEADEAYVLGRYLWSTRGGEDLFRSIRLLERAVIAAPDTARFHAALADAYAFDLVHRLTSEREARAALALDPTLGGPHATLGFLRFFWQRDVKGSIEEFRSALRLDPTYAVAHEWYALVLASQGDDNGAYAEIQEARRLDPASPSILSDQCQIDYLSRDYDRALAACTEAIQASRTFVPAHLTRLAVYEQLSRSADARREYATICSITHWTPCPSTAAAGLLQTGDDRDLASFWRAEIAGLERLPPDLTDYFRIAKDYAHLGDTEHAFASLERLVGASYLDAVFFYKDPAFEPLRSDPRFLALYYRIYTPVPPPLYR